MASMGCCAFSEDGHYFAYCGIEGKLKIWETATNRLKQEYIPNLHLYSPCSALEWVTVSTQATNTSPSPWKKRRRKSKPEETEQRGIVAMGSINGKITLYDIATASVSNELENGHFSCITALTWSVQNILFTAAEDNQIIEWDIEENVIKCKWKSGNVKVTALVTIHDGKFLISADRVIKWWNLSTKQVMRTFTGHASQVISLKPINIDRNTTYIISAATGDRYLSVWALDENKNDKNSVATLAMQDEPTFLSVHVNKNCQALILSTARSGQACLFMYQPNGRSKPLKPSLNITVASELNQKENVQKVPIIAAQLTEDEKMLLTYGSYVNLTFEKITPDFSDKVQCLIRTEFKKSKEKKEDLVMKVKATATENNVEYVAPGTTNITTKRNRTSSTGSQLLLKERLENLSLSSEANATGKSPSKGVNMTQLLIQGLNSKDKNILNNVLFTKNETIIRNTIAKLPVQAITPLLKELTVMLQGRTYPCKIATMWLQALVTTHTAHLLSRPDIAESISPILSLIDAKLTLLTEISRLQGRVSLITGQIAQNKEEHNKDIIEDSLLVYQDSDSSDEDAGVEDTDLVSESDENWEEMSDQEEQQECNEEDNRPVKSEDENGSICS